MTYGSVATDQIVTSVANTSLGAGNASIMKNRILNGSMIIAQRGTSGTGGSSAPTTSPTYPCVDRFYVYSTGATVTATQSVLSLGSSINLLQVAGAASVTAIGVGQRIEALNCYDLAGKAVTISANISNSLLTTVTWTANQPTATNNYTSKTQIATGTFTVSGTDTNYQATFTMPTGTMYGLEIVFTVGAQTSGNLYIYNVQLEVGAVATGYEYRQYQQELALCQRYAYKAIGFLGIAANTGNTYNVMFQFLVSMRTTPTLDSGGSFSVSGGSAGTPAIFNAGYGNANGDRLYFYNSANNWTAGSGVGLNVLFNAEL